MMVGTTTWVPSLQAEEMFLVIPYCLRREGTLSILTLWTVLSSLTECVCVCVCVWLCFSRSVARLVDQIDGWV